MNNNKINKIVIVGGGTAGWMTAASLANHFKNCSLDITVVDSSEIGTIGVGEATIPTIRRFYQALGLTDFDVMKKTQATCKLGIEFRDWKAQGHSFFHPFGLYGQDARKVAFHHYWMKLRQSGDIRDISEYSLAVTLAKQGKFSTPVDNPTSPLSIFDWALHFDASLFAKLMREYSMNNGVTHIDAKITNVNVRAEDGFIASLSLANGSQVEGDLFIDCSGFHGLLIEEALHTGYESWDQWLFCDRAVAAQSEAVGAPMPHTIATAHSAGWQWRIPLQHREGNGHVYASRYISDDEAQAVLLENIAGPTITEPRVIRFEPGRRTKAWNKNCIAVGLAAGFLEPLESTSIALIETAIEKIKLLFPDKRFEKSVVDEFNEMTKLEYERVRDFIILHYYGTQRTDSAMWRDCKTMAIPDTLEKKLKLFKAQGHLLKYPWEIFGGPSWIAIYTGFDILPETYNTAADAVSNDQLKRSFDEMARSLKAVVADTPTHGEFIAKYCAAN